MVAKLAKDINAATASYLRYSTHHTSFTPLFNIASRVFATSESWLIYLLDTMSQCFIQYLILFFFCRMRMLWSVALAVSAASVVLGQRPARIGPDGKPLLNRPVMEECQKSK